MYWVYKKWEWVMKQYMHYICAQVESGAVCYMALQPWPFGRPGEAMQAEKYLRVPDTHGSDNLNHLELARQRGQLCVSPLSAIDVHAALTNIQSHP